MKKYLLMFAYVTSFYSILEFAFAEQISKEMLSKQDKAKISEEILDKENRILNTYDNGMRFPDINQQNFKDPNSQAVNLLFTYCGNCHNTPGPGMYTQAGWTQKIGDMFWRMKIDRDAFIPTPEEKEIIRSYYQKNALHSIKAYEVPQNITGAKEFLSACDSKCHLIPDPNQHTPQEWKKVVATMQEYMREMNRKCMSTESMNLVIKFLQSQSKKQ